MTARQQTQERSVRAASQPKPGGAIHRVWKAAQSIGGSRAFQVSLLAGVLLLGFTYRMYLAKYHTEVGIVGMAPWWHYVVENVQAMERGDPIESRSLYAPGQSVTAYLMAKLWRLDPAVLRVGFGLLDGVAILVLFLLIRELSGWNAGLFGAALYALWPEGASASVNILHDHSPQPLFLFAGLWLMAVGFRKRNAIWPFALGGWFVGFLPLFRADGVLAVLCAAAAAGGVLWQRGAGRIVILAPLFLLFSSLIPGLAYDLTLHTRGAWVRSAPGGVGSAIFIRYGKITGLAGTRHADREVAAVSGSGDPFGYEWYDTRRTMILSSFGKKLFLAGPGRYADIVRNDTWHHVLTSPSFQRWQWLPRGSVGSSDILLAARSGNPEIVMATLVTASRIQDLLTRRWLVLLIAVAGGIAGILLRRDGAAVAAAVMLGWMTALVLLLPDTRYMLVPMSLSFALIPLAATGLFRSLWWRRRTRSNSDGHEGGAQS